MHQKIIPKTILKTILDTYSQLCVLTSISDDATFRGREQASKMRREIIDLR